MLVNHRQSHSFQCHQETQKSPASHQTPVVAGGLPPPLETSQAVSGPSTQSAQGKGEKSPTWFCWGFPSKNSKDSKCGCISRAAPPCAAAAAFSLSEHVCPPFQIGNSVAGVQNVVGYSGGSPGGFSVVKNSSASAGDIRNSGSIPGWGRSLEKGMAAHSSVLAWRIPWTEEPGGHSL